MSDIIDSLKRLERVGSENSKATQKLIAAAAELSQLIVKQFAVVGSERVDVVHVDSSVATRPSFNYAILKRRLCRGHSFVDATRDGALAFSRDIANGLLDYVIETLEKRSAESAKSLAAIEGATNKLKQSVKT